MALDPTIIAGIEHDLKRYKRWKARYKEIDDQLKDVSISTANYNYGVGGGHKGKSDPVASQVISRARLEQEKAWLKRRVERVENALAAMTEAQAELVRLRYFEDKPRKEVEAIMGIEKSTFYRLREQALQTYAEVAGLVAWELSET
mgnify:CR=1 FL=1